MSTLTKWDVYEVVKRMYMQTGEVPTPKQIEEEFRGVVQEIVEEGIQTFNEIIGG